MGDGFIELHKNDYYLKTDNVGHKNKWSSFKEDGSGEFLIHPGEKKPVKGLFVFKKAGKVFIDFSITDSSENEKIEYRVKLNAKLVTHFELTQKKKKSVLLNIKTSDEIKIIIDTKAGETSYDHGVIQILVQDKSFLFEQYIIPFLWAILFIFLYGKNHILIGINAYVIFVLMLFSEKMNFGLMPFRTVITYTLIAMTMTFLFTFIYQELARKKFKVATILSYLVAFVLYVIPMIFIIYGLVFDTKITKEILYAVFQSNTSESFEFIRQFISLRWIALFVFVTGVIGLLLYRQEQQETKKIERSLLFFMIIMFGTLSFSYESELRLFSFVKEGFHTYSRELKLFKEVQLQRKAGELKFEAEKSEKSETYIIVIGESLNKEHMGIYGYQRDTTPLLFKKREINGLLVFDNVYSNHTHTMPVLSLALTEANQFNKYNYYESLSIVDILNKAGFETHWISNQVLQGSWDNLVSVIAHETDHLVGLNHAIGKHLGTPELDGAAIDKVHKILSKNSDKKNRVIFVHLMGSHGLYCSRFPEKYRIFTEPFQKGVFGRGLQNRENSVNCYDNSVLYNDFVVNSFLTELQLLKGVTGLLYFSDHADDVFQALGHNPAKFTYEMTQIPMIAWFSDAYKNRYKSKYHMLESHLNSLYSNDFIYDTLIGMLNIKTDRYKSRYDLTAKEYKLAEQDAYTLHGKRLYTDKSNYLWWQKKNTHSLIDNNLSLRVFPHRVNSIGKLKDIWQDGFRSFEIDVYFENMNNSFFRLGHNDEAMGVTLEEFISSVDYSQIDHILLDFKNLDGNNYKEAMIRLNYLNQKFHIKSKFIIESGTKGSFFQRLKKDGWHTSYHISEGAIVKILKEKNIKKMKQLAQIIAQQTTDQSLSALSFDHKLYPFVKEYLEPLIPKNIVYHSLLRSELYSTVFIDGLNENKLFLDQRIKTILVKYKSLYDL